MICAVVMGVHRCALPIYGVNLGNPRPMYLRWTGAYRARQYRFVAFVLALLACWVAGAPGFAATVDRIDVERDRILIHFDGGVSLASSFVLDGPRRIDRKSVV